MGEVSDNPSLSLYPTGSLLIVAIFVVAILLAGYSWWFRYQATHRAAEFWGEEAVRMIRDAPRVDALLLETGNQGEPTEIGRRDVSQARGMTHLRNALIEDRSYVWSEQTQQGTESPGQVRFALEFSDLDQNALLRLNFSADCCWVWAEWGQRDGKWQHSCRPISSGLKKVFGEFFPQGQ